MNKNGSSKLPLFFYDVLILLAVEFVFVGLYRGIEALPLLSIIEQTVLAGVCVFTARHFGGIYRQIWRYGGIQCYIRLLFVDGLAFLATVLVEVLLPIRHLTFGRLLAVACLNLLGALSIRMVYRYAYKCQNVYTPKGRILREILKFFAGDRINLNVDDGPHKIRIAIVGAGRVGVSLAEDLINNPNAAYIPRCFIDSQTEKAGREIHGIPVFMEDKDVFQNLQDFEIQEIVIAIPELTETKKRSLYEFYRQSGCKVKLYDYPVMQSAGEARRMREFDIEDLLFRKPISISSGRSLEYYRDKTVLITGGGGSIGSELCRQLARMNPKQIILLDIYENGVYDVQQEMKIKYSKVEANVEAIAAELEKHQIQLMKDIELLDRMYELNLGYYRELTMYILAGKKKLKEARETELAALQEKAQRSGLPEDAQAAKDYAEMCDRFEKKLHDLQLTRTVAMQTGPQIRMIQSSDSVMAEKIQSTIVNTIPLWKSQMVIAIGVEHANKAARAQREVTNMTNELLRKNADALKQATVEAAKESERGIVDIETLKHTNEMLISTMDEVLSIQADGNQKRKEAEAELAGIETQLREKLLQASRM